MQIPSAPSGPLSGQPITGCRAVVYPQTSSSQYVIQCSRAWAGPASGQPASASLRTRKKGNR
jgi:hypothetical protein